MYNAKVEYFKKKYTLNYKIIAFFIKGITLYAVFFKKTHRTIR